MSKIIVIYGGGFQPFHAGHFSSYMQAKKEFSQYPNVEFYVTASDNVKTRPIPFKEKQWLAMQAGVSAKDFRNIAVKSPLNPVEILSQYNPNEDIFILVRSERDPISYMRKDGTPGYYQPFKSIKNCKPFNPKGGNGYVFVTKKEDFTIAGKELYSGTQIRDLYANGDDKLRNVIVNDMYPQSPNKAKVKQVLDQYIGTKEETNVEPSKSAIKKLKANPLKENILNLIKNARPLIKEASIEQKIRFMKLMKESMNTVEEDEELDEINFFKIANKSNDTKNKIEPKTSDYRQYFKQEEPADKEKVYHNWEEYHDEQKKLHPLEEARIHQPKYIDLFYVHPKQNNVIKKLVVDMPFHRLDAYVEFLKDKGIDTGNLRYRASSKEEYPYGRKISENPDYLEEK